MTRSTLRGGVIVVIGVLVVGAIVLKNQPKLAGTVVVRFTIVGEPSAGGLIGDSVIDPTATTVNDAQMRECVQETMHAIQIAPPKHGGQIEVEYPFAFSP